MDGLVCLVCASGFNSLAIPLVGSCGHTVCARCVMAIFPQTCSYICPVCRQVELNIGWRINPHLSTFLYRYHLNANNVINRLIGNDFVYNEGRHLNATYPEYLEKLEIENPNLFLDNEKIIDSRLKRLLLSFYLFHSKSQHSAVDYLLFIINNLLQLHDDKKKENEVIVSQIKEKANVFSQWIDEDTVINGTDFWQSLCQAAKHFNNSARVDKKELRRQQRRRDKSKLKSAPKTKVITKYNNIDSTQQILKVFSNIANTMERRFYYSLLGEDRQKWCGKVDWIDDYFYITPLSSSSPTLNDNNLFLQPDQIQHLVDQDIVEVCFQLDVNESTSEPIVFCIYRNHGSWQNVSNNIAWTLAHLPIHFDIRENYQDILFQITTNSKFSSTAFNKDDKIEEAEYVNKAGFISLQDDHQIEVCLNYSRSSRCKNPIGELVSGINPLKRAAISILKGEEVKLCATGIRISKDKSRNLRLKNQFTKRVIRIPKKFRMRCDEIDLCDEELCFDSLFG